jgi:hypothetical protein
MKNSEMPANPTDSVDNGGPPYYKSLPSYGLTKREAFAMAAMQNILSSYNPYEQGQFDSSDFETTVTNAIGLADAMLEGLDK